MALRRTPPTDSALFSLPAAAAYLTLGLRTLRARIAANAIPTIRVSPGRVAIAKADLDAYVDACRERTK